MTSMIEPGQHLYYVPNDKRVEPRFVVVEKVGRKWLHLAAIGMRIDAKTLQADRGRYSSPGRCYLTQAAYEHQRALNAAWADLRRDIERVHQPPYGVTVDLINSIRNALELEIYKK